MANVSKSITRAAALDFVANLMGNEDLMAFAVDAVNVDESTWLKAAATIARMVEAEAKAKARAAKGEKAETPEQRRNKELAEKVYKFMVDRYMSADVAFDADGDEDPEQCGLTNSVTVRDQAGIPDIASTQKAVSLMTSLAKQGRAEKVMVGSKVYYRPIVEVEVAAEEHAA